jgi:hypothetical protein
VGKFFGPAAAGAFLTVEQHVEQWGEWYGGDHMAEKDVGGLAWCSGSGVGWQRPNRGGSGRVVCACAAGAEQGRGGG